MSTIALRSFVAGELTPDLYSRTDIEKYQQGLKTCRNAIVLKTGGVENRSGTEFISEINDSRQTSRLIPFIFSDTQTYVLEFAYQAMRVIKNGVLLTEAQKAITGVTVASPTVITSNAHGYANGDQVYITGLVGPDQLNGQYYLLTNVAANTFELRKISTTTGINNAVAYVSGGTVERVYRITTPYIYLDETDLHFSQSADKMIITHQNYVPYQLARTADTSWTLSKVVFEPSIARPIEAGATGAAGAVDVRYMITSVDGETGEESLPSYDSFLAFGITACTQANPVLMTSVGHGFTLGAFEVVNISGVTGMTQMNDLQDEYHIVYVTPNILSLTNRITGVPLDSTAFTAYTGGGSIRRVGARYKTAAFPITVYAQPAYDSTIMYFNVYRSVSGKLNEMGYIGKTISGEFIDSGITPDLNRPPTLSYNPFRTINNYPRSVVHSQQRVIYSNTINNPQTFYCSRIGSYGNFLQTLTITDSSPIIATLTNPKIQEINHLVDIDKLMVMGSGTEIAILGQDSGFITPTVINPKAQSYNGSSLIRPVVINTNILYVQNRKAIIRDMFYDFTSRLYKGNDLTVYSNHLFDGYTIVAMAYQQNPDSILWCVRSDGALLGLTYLPDQNLIAWHRHDFKSGLVKSVCVVPEGRIDALYVIVERTINGKVSRYTERFSDRFVNNSVVDSIFMDSSHTYDGRVLNQSYTTTTGAGWTYLDDITLTAILTTPFVASDVGKQIHITDSLGDVVRFTVISFTSGTIVHVQPNKTVPTTMRGVQVASIFTRAVNTLKGLNTLEGLSVSVLGDSQVVASPYNSAYPTLTVTSGQLVLPEFYGVIQIGIPYLTDIETLDIDRGPNNTVANKSILITEVAMRIHKSRVAWIGGKPPSDDSVNALEGLTELKIRENESLGDPVALTSRVVKTLIQSQWNSNGRVFIRNTEPLPLAISSIFPSGKMPGGG